MNRPDHPLRLGVIGCGNVLGAYRPIIDRLRVKGEVEVVMACGREAQRESACAALKAPRFTTDAAELLRSTDVDAVLILTSIPEHAHIAQAALELGKHVLVEKPLATTLAEADALIATAERTGTVFVPAPFTILSPTFQTIARRIRNGEIGKPFSARARYGWAGPDWSDWFYKPGGGCLFDLGVYCLTSLTGLLGPAKRVMAMTGIAIPHREVNGRSVKVESEDNAQVLLDFGGDTFAVVTCGFTMQQYRSPALEVYGSLGTIQMLGDDWDPEGFELFQNSSNCWQVFKETAPDWPWADGLNHLIDCIRQNKRPLVTPQHARHVLEIMIKAKESGKDGRSITLETTFVPPNFAELDSQEAEHRRHDRTREH